MHSINIPGGIPQKPSDTLAWVHNGLTTVNTPSGLCYSLKKGVYMTQKIELERSVSNSEIQLTYDAPSGAMLGTITFDSTEFSDVVVSIITGTKKPYASHIIKTAVGGDLINNLNIRMQNMSNKEIRIGSIEILVDQQTGAQTNAADFAQKSILFGLDSDKPEVR